MQGGEVVISSVSYTEGRRFKSYSCNQTFGDKMEKDIIIVDIDGTVADITHRLHFLTGDVKHWDKFNAAMSEDKAKETVLSIINVFEARGFCIWFKTGRFEKYRQVTEDWLIENEIHFDELTMRADGDYRSDFKVKQDMLDGMHWSERARILCVIDDRESVVEMWRKNGLTCLQCQKGDY